MAHTPRIGVFQGMRSCYCMWDLYLDRWERDMLVPAPPQYGAAAALTLPTVLAMGNHDGGANDGARAYDGVFAPGARGAGAAPWALANGDDDRYLPLFFAYFPQHTAAGLAPHGPADPGAAFAAGGGVPPPSWRLPYFEKRLGNATGATRLLFLDTGHVARYAGAQRAWLAARLPKGGSSAHGTVVGVYHVPIYSANMWTERTSAGSALARAHWLPLFDAYRAPRDKTGVAASFEHHVHAFKRTAPMVAGKYRAAGTIYLGDGQMGNVGVPSDSAIARAKETHAKLLLEAQNRYHVWRLDVDAARGGELEVRAIGLDGKVFDSVKRPVV